MSWRRPLSAAAIVLGIAVLTAFAVRRFSGDDAATGACVGCAVCGNDLVENGEQCDPPSPGACTDECRFPPSCNHNGYCEDGEDLTTCESDCNSCGDGIVDGGEQCDDGNRTNGDGCSDACGPEIFCGTTGNTCGNDADCLFLPFSNLTNPALCVGGHCAYGACPGENNDCPVNPCDGNPCGQGKVCLTLYESQQRSEGHLGYQLRKWLASFGLLAQNNAEDACFVCEPGDPAVITCPANAQVSEGETKSFTGTVTDATSSSCSTTDTAGGCADLTFTIAPGYDYVRHPATQKATGFTVTATGEDEEEQEVDCAVTVLDVDQPPVFVAAAQTTTGKGGSVPIGTVQDPDQEDQITATCNSKIKHMEDGETVACVITGQGTDEVTLKTAPLLDLPRASAGGIGWLRRAVGWLLAQAGGGNGATPEDLGNTFTASPTVSAQSNGQTVNGQATQTVDPNCAVPGYGAGQQRGAWGDPHLDFFDGTDGDLLDGEATHVAEYEEALFNEGTPDYFWGITEWSFTTIQALYHRDACNLPGHLMDPPRAENVNAVYSIAASFTNTRTGEVQQRNVAVPDLACGQTMTFTLGNRSFSVKRSVDGMPPEVGNLDVYATPTGKRARKYSGALAQGGGFGALPPSRLTAQAGGGAGGPADPVTGARLNTEPCMQGTIRGPVQHNPTRGQCFDNPRLPQCASSGNGSAGSGGGGSAGSGGSGGSAGSGGSGGSNGSAGSANSSGSQNSGVSQGSAQSGNSAGSGGSRSSAASQNSRGSASSGNSNASAGSRSSATSQNSQNSLSSAASAGSRSSAASATSQNSTASQGSRSSTNSAGSTPGGSSANSRSSGASQNSAASQNSQNSVNSTASAGSRSSAASATSQNSTASQGSRSSANSAGSTPGGSSANSTNSRNSTASQNSASSAASTASRGSAVSAASAMSGNSAGSGASRGSTASSSSVQCRTSADCPSGICLNGMCVPQGSSFSPQCGTTADCPAGQRCTNGRCFPGECGADSECPSGACVEGKCVECAYDRQCADGLKCIDGACGCGWDADCPSGQRCADGQCILNSCGSDTNCPSGACVAGRCLECVYDRQCADGLKCIDGACRCTADEQCPFGRCAGGICMDDRCGGDADCPFGICLNGLCKAQCTQDAQCPDGACAAGRCVGIQCGTGAQCASGECAENGRCRCGNDADCPFGMCVDGLCRGLRTAAVEPPSVLPASIFDLPFENGGLVAWTPQQQTLTTPACRFDNECESGLCRNGACVACGADAECGAGRICLAGRCLATPNHAPVGDTGPAAVAVIAAGAAGGWGWMRRRRAPSGK